MDNTDGYLLDIGADRQCASWSKLPMHAGVGQYLTVPSSADLPEFRYHPNPLATGSAIHSGIACSVCGVERGVVYDGPIFGQQTDALCLACIASGDAARTLAVDDQPAEFTDVGFGVPETVPRSVLDEVAQRTPGFRGWQQEHWLYHCGDAAAFLGRAGYTELQPYAHAIDMLLHENDEFGWTAAQSREYVRGLHLDGEATAYLFRCLTCNAHLAYSDMS